MSAHATAPSGAARAEFLPYVYGAALGRPSRGRPELVLAHLKTIGEIRDQEEPVQGEDGRAGRVTARNAVQGGTSRNGLPERRDYAYRGTGKDTLTWRMDKKQLDLEAEAAISRRTPAVLARLSELEGQLAARGVVDSENAAPMTPAPKRPRQARAKKEAVPAADLEAQSATPPAIPVAVPEPAPAPVAAAVPTAPARRHRKCGYPLGSIGHKFACGDDA